LEVFQRPANDPLKRNANVAIVESLIDVAATMRRGGMVTFLQCDSGSGIEGQRLHEVLGEIFPDQYIVLYNGSAGWNQFGYPSADYSLWNIISTWCGRSTKKKKKK
jgi:hypothetical protein